MAAKGRRPSTDFSPGEAQFILEELVRDGRLSRADLADYRRRVEQEAQSLVDRLKALGWTGALAGAAVTAGAVTASVPAGRRAVKRVARKVSREMRAGRVLQGRYLGRLRQIPAGQREQYSRIAKEKGREEAIAAMEAVLGTEGGAKKRGAKKGRRRQSKKR